MSVAVERKQILEEVRRIPDERLGEAYALLREFRQGATDMDAPHAEVMDYAGSWRDMSDETFSRFLDELTNRRQQAFSRRRNGEASTD